MNELKHSIRKLVDDFNGGFIYQMPCRVLSINIDKKYNNTGENESVFVKASVEFINAKNELKTATAISYNTKDEQLDIMEDAVESEVPLLLESRFDPDVNDGNGGWFLKLSHLVFGQSLDDDDFTFEGQETTERTSTPVIEEEDLTEEELIAIAKKAKKAKKKKAKDKAKAQKELNA